MHGCPLDCLFCLNKQCKKDADRFRDYTPAQLLEEVQKDDLYFKATGGGITFGGGEPLLHPDFIAEFRGICPTEWKINIETSLAVAQDAVEKVADIADQLIIDIKDLDASIYQAYTGRSNQLMKENMQWLADRNMQSKCLVRLPLIPGFNTPRNQSRSRISLAAIGFRHFDEFEYVTRDT